MSKRKLSSSEIDGVQYRRAKLWQIILIACNALNGMAVYSLIGLASYSASLGFGISTVIVGVLLTGTRIFDAVTDPLLAFLYDRVNTKWGKVRPLMLLGWLIQSIGLLSLFVWSPGRGHGVGMFLVLYMVYVVGYTIVNMTAQTLPALITNDPKQRPTVGVWQTAFNYLVPMGLMMVLNVVLLPKYGGTYTLEYLDVAGYLCVTLSFVGVVLVCIGVSSYDKPENFRGTNKKDERLKFSDMWNVLKGNKPLQAYIVSAASDKIAQQAASAAIATTMLFGILIGNMGIATYLQVGSMLPSVLFAVYGARYCGKHGNKESIITWTRNSIFSMLAMIAFMVVLRFTVGTQSIAHFGIPMILYMLLTLISGGFTMCVTTANAAFMADIIDYELDRSGKYIPAVISGTYFLIDKIVSSFSAAIATGCVALIGYTATMPQPGDPDTNGVFWMTLFLKFGLAILGWICTLIAMRVCKLGKAEMVEVQKRIAEKKAALKTEPVTTELLEEEAVSETEETHA